MGGVREGKGVVAVGVGGGCGGRVGVDRGQKKVRYGERYTSSTPE